MQYNGVIHRKLALLDRHVEELSVRLATVDAGQFAEDMEKRWMTERALQVMIEIMVDVAERIIALRKAGPVESASDAMRRLQQLGVIDDATVYSQMVRFRNVLVHEYEDVRPALVYDLARNRLGDFRRFRDEIDCAPEG